MNENAVFSNGKLNMNVFKEQAKLRLVELFKKFKGEKTLIWDQNLVGPFGLLADYSFLKKHGVTQMYMLGVPARAKTEHVIYFIRPMLSQVELIKKTFIKEEAEWRQHHLVYMPRESFACQKLLKDYDIFSYIKSVHEFPVHIFPLDTDLISLEMPSLFKELSVDEDTSSLYEIAMSLTKIQETYGIISQVYGIGKHTKNIFQLMGHLRKELKIDLKAPTSQIDSVIFIDRSVDLYSPLLTQLTYEGLLDEVFGIKNGSIKIPSAKLVPLEQKPVANQEPPTELKQFVLNSSEELYSQIRDKNFNAIPLVLKNTSKQLNLQFEERHNAKSITELKIFVDKIPYLQTQRKSLANHLILAELINEVTSSSDFRLTLEAEQEFIALQNADKIHCFIEEMIGRSMPITKIFRLICLQSLVNVGLKQKVLEFYKKEILQTYGFEHLLDLNNLEKTGLLRLCSSFSKTYSTLRRAFRLTVDNVNEQNPHDIAYVHSCFAPLSARICQNIVSLGWIKAQENLKLLTEPFFEASQEVSSNRKRRNSVGSQNSTLNEEKKIVLVFFIGGCTFSEISSLRFLSKQEDSNVDFIIGTTKLVNGNTFIQSIMN